MEYWWPEKELLEKTLLSEYISKRLLGVLVWTTIAELFENADVTRAA